MAKNIDALLKKKGWTGKEIGQALVSSLIHDIKHKSEPDYKPLFTQKDFDRMEATISTDVDFKMYSIYREIYSGLVTTYNEGQGKYQQFCNGYYRYLMILTNAYRAEIYKDTLIYVPYVITKDEYEEHKAKAEERVKNFKASFNDIVYDMVFCFLNGWEKTPKAIEKILEAYKEEAVTNKRVLNSYNEVWGIGYLLYDNGEKLNPADEEDKEKIKSYLSNIDIDTLKVKGTELFFKGKEEIQKYYKEATGEELPEEQAKKYLDNLESFIRTSNTDALIDKSLYTYTDYFKILKLLSDNSPYIPIWVLEEEAPEDITKYEILDGALDEFYENVENGTKEFKADYPELYKAIESYIKDKIPQAKDLKPTQYNKEFITFGELAKLKLKYYEKFSSVEDMDLGEIIAPEDTERDGQIRRRILLNGVSISQKPIKADVTDLEEFPLSSFGGIEEIYNSDTREEARELKEILIDNAIEYMYSFNALVKVLADIYDLPELAEVELDTSFVERKIKELTAILYTLYVTIGGCKSDRDYKRELIKEVFPMVDCESLKPTQEAIEKLYSELDNNDFLKNKRQKLRRFDLLMKQLYIDKED